MNELLAPFVDSRGKFNSLRLHYATPSQKEPIIDATAFFGNLDVPFLVRLVCIRDEVEQIPICGYCKTPLLTLYNGKVKNFCNSKCYSQTQRFRDSLKSVDHSRANNRRKTTMLEKYGTEFNSQREEVKTILRVSKLEKSNPESLKILEDREKMYEMHIVQKMTSLQISKTLGVFYGTVLDYLSKHEIEYQYYSNTSQYEDSIRDLLDSVVDFSQNRRDIIHPLELDFWIPTHSLAIEVNGIHWHSESQGRNQFYHLRKTTKCESRGIRLLHFWDSEINDHFDIVRSMVLSRLGMNRKIGARKCEIRDISMPDANEHFERTHLQGGCQASFARGLYFDDQLVGCASFSKPRFTKGFDLELIRFSSDLGINVVGGLSKILSTIKESLVSYANRRWSCGKVYETCGFRLSHSTSPSYSYTRDGTTIENRMKYQKHRLQTMEHYSIDRSESEIMRLNGYDRVWDCGNLVYVRDS